MSLDTGAAVAKLRSLTAKFDNRIKATTPVYPQLCTVVPSSGADEEYGLLGAVPAIREWLGDRQFHSVRGAKFTITNKHWESSVAVKKTDIEDDRLALYGPLFEQLAVRAARHPDKLLLSDLVVNATATACLDGQYFFDTDHSWGDSGSQDNDKTSAITAAASPTLANFQTALEGALNAMLAFKDDKGELLHDDAVLDAQNGMSLMILCPLHYRKVALQAVTKGILVSGGDTNIVIADAQVMATPHVTGNYFDLYRLDAPIKPYIFQARAPLTRSMKGMDDAEFKDVKFMTEARYNVGYGAWWNAVRHTFTTA